MKLIDALGKPCPMPVVMAKQALDEGAAALTVLVDNPIAVENLKRLATSRGLTATPSEREGGFAVVLAGEGVAPQPAAPLPCTPAGCGEAVLITRNRLGDGAEELGQSLMKMFLYTLAQGDALPASLIFLNGGVQLPAGEEEQVIESIAQLADRGCEVLVCGTCLNYYGLTEQLRVGTVSNMYDILERLHGAGKVISL